MPTKAVQPYPGREGVCYIFPEGKPDSLGRQTFTMTWFDPRPAYGPSHRGQVFFATVDEHVRKIKGGGHTVQVFPEEPETTECLSQLPLALA